jgi:ligand-binding sensor domain-containing protein
LNSKRKRGGTVFTAVVAAAVLLLSSSSSAAATEVRVLTTADGLPSNWVTALAASPDGKLWVGTGNAGVFLLDPATGRGKGYRAADGLSSDEVTSIALFRGKVYVGTAAGLSVFDGSTWETLLKVGSVTLRNVRLAASPDDKELWACSVYLAGGTVRFDGKEWRFMGGAGRGLFNDIQGFAFLPEGVLMGSGSGMPYLHKGMDVLPLAEGLPPVNIFAVGTLEGKWLVGTSKGLMKYEEKWNGVALPPAFSGVPIFSIAVDTNEAVIGSANGLLKLGKGGPKSLTVADGLPGSRVLAVAFIDDSVVAGTAKGLALVRKW